MERITLITGNGFDLNLGLPTSFSDFVKSNEFKSLLNNNNELCEYLNQLSANLKWIDIEKELATYSVGNPYKDNLDEEYEQLKDAFFDYIKEIEDSEYYIDKDSSAYNLFADIYYSNLKKSDKIISIINFNYTDTFSRIKQHVMGEGLTAFVDILLTLNNAINNTNPIDHIKFTYPHGSINNDYIILGVEDKAVIADSHIFLKKTCDPEYKMFDTSILEKSDRIIFYGHSLGQTDHTYFKTFFLNQCKEGASSKEIIISYFKKTGYYQIMSQLDKLTDQNISSLKRNNDLKLIDASDKSFKWHF